MTPGVGSSPGFQLSVNQSQGGHEAYDKGAAQLEVIGDYVVLIILIFGGIRYVAAVDSEL